MRSHCKGSEAVKKLPDGSRMTYEGLEARYDALGADFHRYRDEAEARIAALEAALPHLLDFRLSPTFDAKGTYTTEKANEWARRLADFAAALRAIDALAAAAPETACAPTVKPGGT